MPGAVAPVLTNSSPIRLLVAGNAAAGEVGWMYCGPSSPALVASASGIVVPVPVLLFTATPVAAGVLVRFVAPPPPAPSSVQVPVRFVET